MVEIDFHCPACHVKSPGPCLKTCNRSCQCQVNRRHDAGACTNTGIGFHSNGGQTRYALRCYACKQSCSQVRSVVDAMGQSHQSHTDVSQLFQNQRTKEHLIAELQPSSTPPSAPAPISCNEIVPMPPASLFPSGLHQQAPIIHMQTPACFALPHTSLPTTPAPVLQSKSMPPAIPHASFLSVAPIRPTPTLHTSAALLGGQRAAASTQVI